MYVIINCNGKVNFYLPKKVKKEGDRMAEESKISKAQQKAVNKYVKK